MAKLELKVGKSTREAFGLALAHSCALTAVALHLAPLLGRAANTVRQRLREFYKPAGQKAGRGRTELDPAACCAPLVRCR